MLRCKKGQTSFEYVMLFILAIFVISALAFIVVSSDTMGMLSNIRKFEASSNRITCSQLDDDVNVYTWDEADGYFEGTKKPKCSIKN